VFYCLTVVGLLQTTMWECIVDYQHHRCLQENLKPHTDGGAMYTNDSSSAGMVSFTLYVALSPTHRNFLAYGTGRRGSGGKVVSPPQTSSPFKAKANDRKVSRVTNV